MWSPGPRARATEIFNDDEPEMEFGFDGPKRKDDDVLTDYESKYPEEAKGKFVYLGNEVRQRRWNDVLWVTKEDGHNKVGDYVKGANYFIPVPNENNTSWISHTRKRPFKMMPQLHFGAMS